MHFLMQSLLLRVPGAVQELRSPQEASVAAGASVPGFLRKDDISISIACFSQNDLRNT